MFEIKKGEYRENIESFAIAVLTILFVMIFLVQSFIVDGVSMEPTLHNRNRLIVNKFIFKFRYPKTGDIVVIIPPGDPTRKYIKRVIAGPGQTVRVEAQKVYVNGIELNEPYIKEKTMQDYGERTVPNETIFVMGDNRNNSTDSRVEGIVGFVPLKNVIGKAIFVFWPFPEVKVLFNPNYDQTYFSK
ncbi:MAG TPA: signal peptidase I [Bacillota bacterium]|nr:signal peptidase I [Bacillota bacterium]